VRLGSERGSGSLLGIAVVGGTVALTALALPLYLGLATKPGTAGAADAAALAGADVAVGIASGFPCEEAARVAEANRVILAACSVDGLVVSVTVRTTILGISVLSSATAGPPARE
jgi:secretion/DNA translocation related TadE-like protein